jgi:signal transduction histidine kinase
VKYIYFLFPREKLQFDKNIGLTTAETNIPDEIILAIENINLPILFYSEIIEKLEGASNNTATKSEILKKALSYYEKYQIDLTVQILLEKKLIGLIIFGEKLPGELFSGDDINLLKTLSYQAAVALQRAQLFEEVKNYSLELENKVEQRTAKIKGLQEEQKKMMLEIAHGLQTPLTILKAEISQLNQDNEECKKVKVLENSIDRISKFIYDMLRIAKIENESQKLKMENIDLSNLFSELIESFEIITEEKGIKIIHNIEPDIFIKGDRHELEELMMNLAGNCVKYIGNTGKKEIEIMLIKNHEEANLIIKDSGIGISPEHLPHLFERFYRIEKPHEPLINGTGLGLVICKKIIERHRGKIEVLSQLGKGTKFIITFPLIPLVRDER